jgi:hypothetical protein
MTLKASLKHAAAWAACAALAWAMNARAEDSGDGSAATAAPPSITASAAAAPREPADTSRQVLVMLRLPLPHFRADGGYAGAAADGYGDAAGRAARLREAQSLARDHGLQLRSEWPMPVLGVDCIVLDTPAGTAPEALADTLAHDGRVVWAQPMHDYRAQGSAGLLLAALPGAATAPPAAAPRHDDPLYPVQPAAAAWQLASLHQAATGRGITVAVIDSGVDAHHPDLDGQVAWNEDFVATADGSAAPAAPPPEQHGTEVAGVIAAHADNHVGIAGIAPSARLMALRACWQRDTGDTVCSSLTLAQALQFAIRHDADVINMSLAGPPDRLLDALLQAALARGISVVAAEDRALPGGGFPATHAGVIGVVDDLPGPAPPGALHAPGRDVPTTVPGGRFALASGSSFASAHVAGLVALLRQLQQRPSARGVQFVRANAGGIDACASLEQLDEHCICDCGPLTASRRSIARMAQ